MLADAVGEAQTALAELRELAHGIFPAILAQAGLGPALENLADSAPIAVEIRDMPEDRLPAATETAAYLLVVEALEDAAARGATQLTVDAVHGDSQLVVTAEDDGSARTCSMVAAADRVGAVGGTLDAEATRVSASMPAS